jgi:hypothetical protein
MRIIIALVLLASCSPAARFDRLIKKHPELVKRMDTTIRVKVTVYKTDTFYVKGDTIIREANLDSLTSSFSELYSDSLYSISMSLDSLKKIKAKVVFKPRTLTKLDTIYVDKVITVPAKVVEVQNDRWKYPFFITWIVIMLTIALKKLWK